MYKQREDEVSDILRSQELITEHSSGVGVSNTPEAVNEATATTAVYLLLATVRRFTWAEARLKEGGFSPLPEIENNAHDLSGRTLGILGMGGIGRVIVNYLRPFGLKIVYHNRSVSSLAPPEVTYCPDMCEMLRQVDILMISVPLNDKTRGMIGSKEMKTMKRGSIIINTARGPVVNEEDLIHALEDGQVSVTGRVWLTPYRSGQSAWTYSRRSPRLMSVCLISLKRPFCRTSVRRTKMRGERWK